jgi:hypothetical protein
MTQAAAAKMNVNAKHPVIVRLGREVKNKPNIHPFTKAYPNKYFVGKSCENLGFKNIHLAAALPAITYVTFTSKTTTRAVKHHVLLIAASHSHIATVQKNIPRRSLAL